MDDIESLKEKIEYLEKELRIMKKSQVVDREKKDPNAWAKLLEMGEEISKSWKVKKTSWQLISESRR